MSEYQYHEFQAIDRPLTKGEMTELRALSTRAMITSTRLQNEYHWGDFKGNPLTLMERYFDVHLYFANWGTHQLMLRLPRQLLDTETALRYCFSDGAEVHTKGDNLILSQAAARPATAATATGRTVGELVSAAEGRAEARRREQARRAAEEQARRQREAAAARAVYPDSLVPRQEAIWRQIEDPLEFKRAKEYDQATQLLIDLRDVSARTQTAEAFHERLRSLRLRHAKKPSFIDRLNRAALSR